MSDRPLTIWEQAQLKGYSRRDFLQFCSWLAAAAGIPASAIGQVVQAMDTKPRPPVVWFHFQECTCCSESFIRSSHPMVADILLDKISLDYTETLQAAAGKQAEECAARHDEEVQGPVPDAGRGGGARWPTAASTAASAEGRRSISSPKRPPGPRPSCAGAVAPRNGCIQAANPNPTGATPIHKVISGTPIVNVPGCPPIGEVMAGTIVYLLAFDRIPHLDQLGRPKAFYSRRVHDSCYRRPNYDAGLFVEAWDDENAKRGYCLYKMGCRGPVTYNDCGITRWNNGVSFPIQSGHGCIGCSEARFWDNGPFYRHLPSFPGFGIETTADKVGLAIGAATAAGIAAHAVLTNIRKHKLIQQEIEESEPPASSNEGGT